MKSMIAMMALACCAAPVAGSAAALADVSVYGSYYNVTDKRQIPVTFDPSGGGGGVRVRVNVPFVGLFGTGEYQINQTSDDVSGFGKIDDKFTNYRIGVGDEIGLGPVSVLGRVEYVNYHVQISGAATAEGHNDGVGVHVGADAGLGIAGVYGEAGYLRLSDSQGPEFLAGARVSVMPLLSLFGEYRFSRFVNRQGNGNDSDVSDYHLGVKISF